MSSNLHVAYLDILKREFTSEQEVFHLLILAKMAKKRLSDKSCFQLSELNLTMFSNKSLIMKSLGVVLLDERLLSDLILNLISKLNKYSSVDS